MNLKCSFTGRPLPRVVWYKGDEKIINGSQGFYYEFELTGKDAVTTFLHLPRFEEKNEGDYTCTAENNITGTLNIPGWSSKRSHTMRRIFECKSSAVVVTFFYWEHLSQDHNSPSWESTIGLLNPESRHYFWLDPATFRIFIPIPPC